MGSGDTAIDALNGANRSLRELRYHRREVGRGEREERKAHTKAASPASSASTKARSPVRSREAGLERGVRRVLRGLRRAQRSRSCPGAPRATHRLPTGAQGARLARPWPPRSPDSTAPGRPPAAPGSGSVSARPRVCSHGSPSGRSPAVLTCAPSAEQRAESGGARARHPRGGPCSGGGPLLRLRCQGGGRFALLLIHEAAVTARDWTDDVPAPASLPLTPDAVVPRPSKPTYPPLLLRWGLGGGGRVLLGAPETPLPETPRRAPLL